MVEFRDLYKSSSDNQRKQTLEDTEVSSKDLPQAPDQDLSKTSADDESSKIVYRKACGYIGEVFGAARAKVSFSLEPGIEIIQNVVEIQSVNDSLFALALHLDDRDNFMINHCVNVAIFAIKLGTNLGFNKDQQVEIGIAALMHDVGTVFIPDSIVNKKERLSDEEFHLFRERPEYSYRILRSLEGNYAHLAEIAIQVYEKIDGSGYPQGIKSEEIHEYAQIIGLVDMYEALIHSRPQREKFLHFAAVKEIVKNNKNSFQRRHLKVLLSTFSIFPVYSYVQLNSDAIGKVVATYPDQPMRPMLQIVYDSQRRRVLTERIVNLPESPLLYIVDSVSEEKLKEIADA